MLYDDLRGIALLDGFTDEQVADLDARLGHAGLVELTQLIAVENQRARANAALGVRAQGFAASCEVPSSALRSVPSPG
jgi:hypothetical protein